MIIREEEITAMTGIQARLSKAHLTGRMYDEGGRYAQGGNHKYNNAGIMDSSYNSGPAVA